MMLSAINQWFWQRLSLRWKLILWLMITVLALYLPLSLAGLLVYRDLLLRQVDDQLASLAHQQLGSGPVPWHSLLERREWTLPPQMPWPTDAVSARWTIGSTTLSELGRPPQGDGAVPTSFFRSGQAEMALAGGHSLRLTLYLPRSVAEKPLESLRDGLLISTVTGLAAVAIAGLVMAHQALAPIRDLQQAARQLSPAALDHQIHLRPSSPEVSRLQDELNEARQRLQRGYAAQERFARNVSHELKTPIAVLLTQAQTLPLRHTLPEPALRFLLTAEQEMRRLGRLVESMLLLARLQAIAHHTPAQCPARESISVADLLLAATEAAEAQATQAGVPLRVDTAPFEEEDSPVLQGHQDLLVTMLDNLLRNAIRFSPPGRPVTLTRQRNSNTLCLAVRDCGPGFPDELLRDEELFEPFTQAADQGKHGTGLGLQIARGIAELHGGTLRAENPADGGACLFVHLPLSESDRSFHA